MFRRPRWQVSGIRNEGEGGVCPDDPHIPSSGDCCIMGCTAEGCRLKRRMKGWWRGGDIQVKLFSTWLKQGPNHQSTGEKGTYENWCRSLLGESLPVLSYYFLQEVEHFGYGLSEWVAFCACLTRLTTNKGVVIHLTHVLWMCAACQVQCLHCRNRGKKSDLEWQEQQVEMQGPQGVRKPTAGVPPLF